MTHPSDSPAKRAPESGPARHSDRDDRDARARLRARGLRVTTPRLQVLAWVAEHPHTTAAEIGRGLSAVGAELSNQGVYDVLAACTEAGLLRRIEPAEHSARYETRTGDNHHHLVCRVCGGTRDVDCAVGAAPCLTPSDAAGFTLDEAEVVFWGTCSDCTPAATGPAN